MTAEQPTSSRPSVLWGAGAVMALPLGGALLLVEGQQGLVARVAGALLVVAGIACGVRAWQAGAPGRRATREDLRRRGYLRWEQPFSWAGHLVLVVGLSVGIVLVATSPGADSAAQVALTVVFAVVFTVGLVMTAASMVQRFRRLGLRSGGERAKGHDMWFAFYLQAMLALQGANRLGEDVTGPARAAGVASVLTGAVLAVAAALVWLSRRRRDQHVKREAEEAR